jgi:hypothetical protein
MRIIELIAFGVIYSFLFYLIFHFGVFVGGK